MSEFLEIDGSVLEGGGQILRNSISFSAILGIPVRVTKIRACRSKPGLAMQHLKGIQLVAAMCQARLKGASLGSTEIEFTPGKLKGGEYEANTQTAGSISLLLQVALPCALAADSPVSLVLRGGTNADMAPQIDYMTEVFLPALKKFGADFNLDIIKRGYFPKGGGCVKVTINPVRQLSSVNITDRGSIDSVQGWSFVAGNLPMKMTYIMADAAKQELGSEYEANIECYREDRAVAPDNASGIIMTAATSNGCVLGADGLGRRGGDAASVGRGAGLALKAELDSAACLDTRAQDQVILYMALASGRSVVKVGQVSLHTQTAIHIAELIAKVNFKIQTDDDHNLIECTGIGFTNETVPV